MQQDKEICFNMGNAYFLGEGGVAADREEAFSYYENAALQGHPAACYNLGLMYKYGEGIAKDDALAAAWFDEALAAGYKLARAALAELYYKSGSCRDLEKAYVLYEELAEEGNPSALYNLGNMYEHGDWAYQSASIAKHYFERAAAQGHVGAKIKLSKFSKQQSVN